MDNASIHSQAVIDHDLVTVKKLPPYSPFLNIVENFFSIWKAGVKRRLAENNEAFIALPHGERMAHLATIAEVAIEDLSITHAHTAFQHLCGRLPECFNRADMFM